jgi:hypothetical protein
MEWGYPAIAGAFVVGVRGAAGRSSPCHLVTL